MVCIGFSRTTLANLSITHIRSIDLFCQSTFIHAFQMAKPPQHTTFYSSICLSFKMSFLCTLRLAFADIRVSPLQGTRRDGERTSSPQSSLELPITRRGCASSSLQISQIGSRSVKTVCFIFTFKSAERPSVFENVASYQCIVGWIAFIVSIEGQNKKAISNSGPSSRIYEQRKKEKKIEGEAKKKRGELTSESAVVLFQGTNKLDYVSKKAQRDNFGDELRCIKKGELMPKKSKLRNMCVELDQDDVMRATGRLDRHQSLDAEKTPLRASYSSVNGAEYIDEKPTTPQQGELPTERLKAHEPPFNCSAIDYFGPMIVTVGRRTEKRWGVLITCLTTRAVHLEIAASLTPSSAILALRRFMARRGTPTVMYSDNATNFTKVNKELKEAALEVEKYATAKRIVWKSIPPSAPHMGGAWERMIRTIKSSLYAVLKERKPREETLHTLLLEVEHIVNSRPLTPVEPDLNREALTPNHFLIGRSCGISPIGIFKATDADSHTWKTAQRLADEFWHRWSMEYLPNLLLRKTSTAGHLEPKVGDPVLIADKTMPRGLWPRGRIVKTIPGRDNKVRIVEIQTKLGILKRPTSRLVVLT
ncbi:hypothetical protein EVAR_82664_1 [Eumeta japonica]|uniref:Integrase catalytic domain-containing protein n=1 Tax=Eumeta variegata TaxID=151549 RepID=A0A4C1VB48_EUMVA|nr:hypothetical protein EVAR_82664_1 [Eumeta japonica]